MDKCETCVFYLYDEEYDDYVRPKGVKRYGILAAAATIVLPEPTSPCTRRFIGR